MSNITYFDSANKLDPRDIILVTRHTDENVHGCVVVAMTYDGSYKFHVNKEDVYDDMLNHFRNQGFRTYAEELEGDLNFRKVVNNSGVSKMVTVYSVCVDESGCMTVVSRDECPQETEIEPGDDEIGL